MTTSEKPKSKFQEVKLTLQPKCVFKYLVVISLLYHIISIGF